MLKYAKIQEYILLWNRDGLYAIINIYGYLTREVAHLQNIELTDKEFRRLLDLVYIGNWILNSTRLDDRFEDYDKIQEKLFSRCADNGMRMLIDRWGGHVYPSKAYEEGGIHEAIADYEDAIFYDLLAEVLAQRDLGEDASEAALTALTDEYLDEFEANGLANLTVDM